MAMTQSFLLFATKCSVIVYFATCTGTDHLSIDRSATPVITKGVWKAEWIEGNNAVTGSALSVYKLIFRPNGDLRVSNNGMETKGNWSEDNISKSITITVGNADPVLTRLNDKWNVEMIDNNQVSLMNRQGLAAEKLKMTSLN